MIPRHGCVTAEPASVSPDNLLIGGFRFCLRAALAARGQFALPASGSACGDEALQGRFCAWLITPCCKNGTPNPDYTSVVSRLLLFIVAFSAAAQNFDRVVQTYVADRNFMGSVLVARGNQVLFSKGYGFANFEWRIPNDAATKFRIASISKQFTAAAILLLEERGKLTLDDPIKMFLPDAPAEWTKIALRNLLTHTSGVPDILDSPEFAGILPAATTPEE